MAASDRVFMGIDAGSVSMNTVLLNENGELLAKDYRRTKGRVLETVRDVFRWYCSHQKHHGALSGIGVTGSGRRLVAAMTGADLVKNEITAHTRAALFFHPDVGTILEIGGEDSKIILIENGIPVDFAMNTLCAAGTGAFLDQLAGRLGIPVEDVGSMAGRAREEVSIAGRCTVFAESDMIFKQQAGYPTENIIKGLCRSLVRNYLGDTARGKKIRDPVLFQGGVAANSGIRDMFREELGTDITVPEHHEVMGAIGAALLVKEYMGETGNSGTEKRSEQVVTSDFSTGAFICPHCENRCEILSFREDGSTVGYQGGRCERWTAEVPALH